MSNSTLLHIFGIIWLPRWTSSPSKTSSSSPSHIFKHIFPNHTSCDLIDNCHFFLSREGRTRRRNSARNRSLRWRRRTYFHDSFRRFAWSAERFLRKFEGGLRWSLP